jgi:hypothetical protein
LLLRPMMERQWLKQDIKVTLDKSQPSKVLKTFQIPISAALAKLTTFGAVCFEDGLANARAGQGSGLIPTFSLIKYSPSPSPT